MTTAGVDDRCWGTWGSHHKNNYLTPQGQRHSILALLIPLVAFLIPLVAF
jgi:hypothetical protein